MTRKSILIMALLSIPAVLLVPSMVAPVHAPNTFQQCDVFAAVGSSKIAWWRPNACGIPTSVTFQGFLTAGVANAFMTGMGFNTAGCALGVGNPCLYATMFGSQAVAIFDNTGAFLGTCGTGYNLDPESILVDLASTPPAIFVGQADGTHHILKFNINCSTGSPSSFSPATEFRGTDWIDLSSNLCTMLYTSEGIHVKSFNICTNTQNTDFATLPNAAAYALRIRTSGTGGGGSGSVLVADSTHDVHVSNTGGVISTCDSSSAGAGGLFSLNVLPGANQFVSGSFLNNQVDYMTVANCDLGKSTPDFSFNAVAGTGCTGTCTLFGLTVFGESTAVSQLRTTSTTVSCNPPTVAVNQATSCTAVVTDTSPGPPITPSGTVNFSSSGSGTFSPPSCMLVPVNPSTSTCSVSYTPNPGSEGTHTITATYGGDPNHSGSSGMFALGVTKRSTITSVSCNPGTVPVNSPTTCTATVTDTSPGTPITPMGQVDWSSSSPGLFSGNSGPMTCTLSGAGPVATCSVTYTPAPGSEGTTTITAVYGGDRDHFGSSGSTTITVTQRPTSTMVNCNPGSVPVNAPTSCTATVTDIGPGIPIPPTGTVGFSSSGSGTFSPPSCMLVPVNPSTSTCSVSYTPNPGSEGPHTITGTYGGDINHSGSSGSFNVVVTKRTTSTSVTCSPNFVQPGVSTTCQATVTDTSPGTPITPTGTVTWSSSGAGTFTPTNSCTLSGSGATATCTVTYTPSSTGTQVITATYQGDRDHSGSSGSTELAVGVPPKSAVTDSSFCSFDTDPNTFGQQFTLIYIQDPSSPGTFELTASNPGQFYYNVFYNGPPGTPVTLQIRIPYPFVTQGSVPVQEFGQTGFTSQGCFTQSDQLSGFTVTGTPTTTPSGATSITLGDYVPQAMGSFVTLTVSGTVPATGLVYVTIHLDYGFKGVTGYANVSNNAVNTDTSKNVPQLQSYTFSFNTVVGTPDADSRSVQSENVFKGCAMGFCGMVMDSQSTPVSGATVQVYGSNGLLIGSVQTDQYGFYSIPYTLLGTNLATFTISVPAYNLQQTVTLATGAFTLTNFATP